MFNDQYDYGNWAIVVSIIALTLFFITKYLTFVGIDIVCGRFLVMAISTIIIIIGLVLITDGWRKVYHAEDKLITTGIYSKMRHPPIFWNILGDD